MMTVSASQSLVPERDLTLPPELSENIILASLNDLHNWARLSSIYPLMFGTACCFMEFAALIGSRFDVDRFGFFPRMTPRQADLLITAGTIHNYSENGSSISPTLRANAGTEVRHRHGRLHHHGWDVQ